eukprot:symbB.v1.2.004616.t1/scaffold255.1/size249928/6
MLWRFLFCIWPIVISARGLARSRGFCSFWAGSTCVITGNKTLSGNKVLITHLEFRGAQWTCTSRTSALESMEIEIRMETSPGKASKAAKPTGKVSFLEGSIIHCPTVIITAHKVVISDTSEISFELSQ